MTKADLFHSALDCLPMFASDRDIAVALVGKAKADKWLKERLPALEGKPGFPPVDPFHGGRAVPLVRLFYANYLGAPKSLEGPRDGRENEAGWKRSRLSA